MKIQSVDRELSIVKRVYSTDTFEINLCKYLRSNNKKIYTVIIIKDSKIVYETISIFSSMRKNLNLVDFIECFTQDSYLYVVFSYHGEEPLHLNDIYKFPLMQRVDIVKQILSKIIVLNIPKEILSDVISNINMDKGGKIYFNYFLKNIDMYPDIKEKSIVKRIGIFILNVFSEEIHYDSVEGLRNFIFKCEDGKFENIMEIYKDYILLYDNFLNSLDFTRPKKISWIKKIIGKSIALFNKTKLVIITILLSISVAYYITSLVSQSKPKNPTQIKSIGSVQVIK